MKVIANRERTSKGTSMEWREVQIPAQRRLGLERGTKAYISDRTKCSLMVSHNPRFGWHLSIAHPWRPPLWSEIASARYELVPNEVTMAMYLPPEDEYVNLHEYCFHLHECKCGQDRGTP